MFLLAATYAGCNQMLAVAFFTIGMGLMGFYYSSMRVNALDLAPNYAGTLMAIINGLGAISGMITPYLVGALIEDVSIVVVFHDLDLILKSLATTFLLNTRLITMLLSTCSIFLLFYWYICSLTEYLLYLRDLSMYIIGIPAKPDNFTGYINKL